MARSLRNSQALAAKSIKRGAFFTDVVKAREERLAKKLASDLKKQKVKESLKKSEGGEETEAQSMEIDGEAQPKDLKKVNTSGWRPSRHVTYKKNKIKKNKRRKALVFKK
ncbi:hypothetical protein DASC09_034200 [Saccharomycopsis crataegensis]|uniref:DUF2423 domain-containing protein n=1 Tax=Saccharomycopsis crataegensis TaxID=43959 RepID=A0AAV5QP49_9ASCO|nr:hypothetical protein DASC09_034200 [Saccharomycopsis crataegensis]